MLAHEAFHVLTRNNPDFRKKMYSIIGFNILPKEIEFPEELKERFISNPDVIRHDSYATFTINGEKKDCCMVIYSTRPYEGGSFFQYLNIGLVPIDKNTCKAIEKEGKAVVYSINEASDFYDRMGRNTQYIIDPEEVLADNFSLLLTGMTEGLPSPEVIQKWKRLANKPLPLYCCCSYSPFTVFINCSPKPIVYPCETNTTRLKVSAMINMGNVSLCFNFIFFTIC